MVNEKLNYKLYKESHEELKRFKKQLFRFCLKELPREFIIQELSKKKIIKQDYVTRKVEVSKDDNTPK